MYLASPQLPSLSLWRALTAIETGLPASLATFEPPRASGPAIVAQYRLQRLARAARRRDRDFPG